MEKARVAKTKNGDKIYMVPEKIVKPGGKSSEFYGMLISQVIGVLLLTGVISPEQKDVVDNAINEFPHLLEVTYALIGGIISLASSIYYAFTRMKVKTK